MTTPTLFDFINSLWNRAIDASVTEDNKLLLTPSSKLSDRDRAYIRAHRDKLIALVRTGDKLQHLPDGWQHDEHMTERVILVRGGRLIDSCLFRTETGAKAFLSLVHTYPAAQTFHAASAIEDGETNEARADCRFGVSQMIFLGVNFWP